MPWYRQTAKNFHRFYRLVCRDKVCVYCGCRSTTIDHFVPLSVIAMIADAVSVGEVSGRVLLPSCGECNRLAGNGSFVTVAAKRRYIHQKLAKRYARVLIIPDWTDAEINELSYGLAHFVRQGLEMRRWIEERLGWQNNSHREPVKLAAVRSSLAVSGRISAANSTAKPGTTNSARPSLPATARRPRPHEADHQQPKPVSDGAKISQAAGSGRGLRDVASRCRACGLGPVARRSPRPRPVVSPDDIRATVEALGLSQQHAARLIGVDPRNMRRWIAGSRAMPEPARRLLLALGEVADLRPWLERQRSG